MTNQKKHGSKKEPIKYIDVCEECYRMEKKIDHIEARGSKFCPRHQCPVTGASGIKCSIKKKSPEELCSFHFVPVCNVAACKSRAFDNTPHCEAHSCSTRGCKKLAKPGEGWDYCNDHKCSDPDCQLPRKRILEKGALVRQSFCRKHECQTKSCTARKVTEKNYCASHCCTIESCPDERQGEPLGPLCLEHYNEKIGTDAVKNAEKAAKEKAEKELEKEKERTEKETKKAAEKRRKREEEEVLSEQSREDRRRRRFEKSPSGSSGTSYHDSSPPRSRGSDRPRVTTEKKYYFEEDDWEDDEAYRSGSSTGPGERYAGFARRRASASGLRDEYFRPAYGRGAYKPGW
ncbi:hypothetical protein F5882DRAFT_415590 [Hyaloscypha sp. PMI_1271]|nr:hypothetical protein F5882DRAFT_415590 [Hyaloscypha sp. PMI_1271]